MTVILCFISGYSRINAEEANEERRKRLQTLKKRQEDGQEGSGGDGVSLPSPLSSFYPYLGPEGLSGLLKSVEEGAREAFGGDGDVLLAEWRPTTSRDDGEEAEDEAAAFLSVVAMIEKGRPSRSAAAVDSESQREGRFFLDFPPFSSPSESSSLFVTFASPSLASLAGKRVSRKSVSET